MQFILQTKTKACTVKPA